jgi:hypothetical protein
MQETVPTLSAATKEASGGCEPYKRGERGV